MVTSFPSSLLSWTGFPSLPFVIRRRFLFNRVCFAIRSYKSCAVEAERSKSNVSGSFLSGRPRPMLIKPRNRKPMG